MFSFTPKEFSPDKTKVSIILDNKEYPLQYKNGKYTEKLILDLFKNYNSQEVRFTTNGVISSQVLDWQICPAVEFLPGFLLNSGELPYNTVKNSDGKTTLSISDFGKIVSQNEVNYNLTDCNIITEVDGKELYSDSIDLNEKGQTEYMNAFGEEANNSGFTPVYFKYEHSLSVSQNVSVCIYADMTDTNGLIYRCSLLNIKLNDGEAYSENYFCSYDIYDKNGELLFSFN